LSAADRVPSGEGDVTGLSAADRVPSGEGDVTGLSAIDRVPSRERGGSAARIVRSFGYAFQGLVTLVRTQPNFGVHIVAAVFALVLGIVLRLSTAEMALLVLTMGTVLAVEALNTCLETLCDLVSPTYHPLVKKCKDVSAAAVLISAVAAVGVAALLFLPRLF
jgi:diacylglycerol kinase